MTEECIELISCDWDRVIYVLSLLILLLIQTDPVSKKRHDKRNPVSSYSSNSSKVVFTLLTEVLTVYMRFSTIHILGKALYGFCRGFSKVAKAGTKTRAGARAQASRTILKICCKSFLIYLRISVVAIRITATRNFVSKGPIDYLENSDLESGEESKRVTEKYPQWRQLRP